MLAPVFLEIDPNVGQKVKVSHSPLTKLLGANKASHILGVLKLKNQKPFMSWL